MWHSNVYEERLGWKLRWSRFKIISRAAGYVDGDQKPSAPRCQTDEHPHIFPVLQVLVLGFLNVTSNQHTMMYVLAAAGHKGWERLVLWSGGLEKAKQRFCTGSRAIGTED